MDAYAAWTDPERVVVNVASIYRELSGEQEHPGTLSLFAMMAEYAVQAG